MKILTVYRVATKGSVDAMHWVSQYHIRWGMNEQDTMRFPDEETPSIEKVRNPFVQYIVR